MKRSTRMTLSVLALAGLFTGGCSTPEYCKAGPFPEFVEQDWQGYCADFDDHLNNPGKYGLLELTRFFDVHPERSRALSDRLGRYENPQQCFSTNRQKLALRGLQSCISNDDGQRVLIVNTWKARAEPWIVAHEDRSQYVKPRLGDLLREGKRLLAKVSGAYDYQSSMDPSDFREWEGKLEEERVGVQETAKVNDEWRALVEAASDEYLRTAILADFGPRVARLSEVNVEQQERLAELDAIHDYLRYAIPGAGRPCPDGKRAPSEARAASRLLSERVSALNALQPRIGKKSVIESDGQEETETFEGFVCGKRPESRQMVSQPSLCGLYLFRIARTRPAGERRWGDWTVESFEEGGPEVGYDCGVSRKR